jgi:hypothetical protein
MRKYTYQYDEPLTIEMASASSQEAQKRLQDFNDEVNALAYKMGILIRKGSRIECIESEL